jgi:hypothetical protein
MAGFCGKCGSPLNDTAAFCGGCGAQVPPAPTAQAAYTPAPATYVPAQPLAPVARKSNTLLKVVVAFVVIIFVGGALALGGLWYAAQKIKAKVHAVSAQVLRGSVPSDTGASGGLLSGASSSDDSPGGFKGDPCRFLSKAEVSQAVGLQVIRTEARDGGCSYVAKGDPADVTAKHMSSMIGGLGADAQTQTTIQKFAGAMFAQQEATDKANSAEAATGEIPVLVVSFTQGNAVLEMKANRAAFEHIGANAPSNASKATVANSATGDLTGIGDEAYVTGGSMLMLRKGNVMARFMYVSCPCNTDNIKPLAQTVASRL